METQESKEVKTNIGTMPIEDYHDIMAFQYGFNSYEDMRTQGFSLGYESTDNNSKGDRQ